jgi:hypothetical protein
MTHLALINNHSLTHLLILILPAMSCITVPDLPLCLGVPKPIFFLWIFAYVVQFLI